MRLVHNTTVFKIIKVDGQPTIFKFPISKLKWQAMVRCLALTRSQEATEAVQPLAGQWGGNIMCFNLHRTNIEDRTNGDERHSTRPHRVNACSF
jgi:hypothetical protein